MKQSEAVRRIVITIRAIGLLIVALGIIGLGHSPSDSASVIFIVTTVLAAPCFVAAWIIDGFAADRA